MSNHAQPAPIATPFWTPGVMVLAAIAGGVIGLFAAGLRSVLSSS